MQHKSQFHRIPSSPLSLPIPQQETLPLPTVTPAPDNSLAPLVEEKPDPLVPLKPAPKRRLTRIVAGGITLLLAGAIYVIWFVTPSTAPAPVGVTQQSFGPAGSTSSPVTTTGGALHVYVLGSVRNPGVYTLPAGSRVYQLLQAAGGAKPQADLVSLNLAAPLTDGQEVYVLAIGEIPPTYQGGVPGPNGSATATTLQAGQMVNINTATSDEMRQLLHVSSTTSQKIIAARPYTSVDQLLQVVSRSIYDKIKNSVTV